MKFGTQTLLTLTLAASTLQLTALADDSTDMTNKTEKLGYSIGMSIGNNLKRGGFEVNPDDIAAGIKDVLGGKTTKLTDKEAQSTIMAYQQEMRAKREGERLKIAEKNRKAGEDFLASNKSKDGIKTMEVKLQDGSSAEFQYKILAEGSGQSPKSSDTAVLNIKGTTIDGKEFENANDRKTPVTHMREKALAEALQMMKPGAKWEIFAPSSLAYGDFGAGQAVEPGDAVIFDVELVSIETPQPLTSDIIKVPSSDEMAKGAKIEVIKPEDAAKYSKTNSAASKN